MDEQKSQIDFVVRLFQTGMKKVEDLTPKLEKNILDIEDYKNKFDMLLDTMNLESDRINEIHSSLSNNIKKIVADNEVTLSRFKDNEKSTADVNSSLSDITTKMGDLSHKINTLSQENSKYSLQSSLDSLRTYIDSFEGKINEVRDNATNAFLKIVDQQNAMRETQTFLSTSIELLKASSSKDQREIANLKNDLVANGIAYNDRINQLNQNIPLSIEMAINAIPKPVIPRIEDAQKAFSNQLEPIMLDAKNASLRAVNNETKIIILERKIDQLQLLLNKLQMQE